MEVFLAGLTQGNLSPYFKTLPDRFDKETMEGNMKVFLAGDVPYKGMYDETIMNHRPYILESFYYADKDTERLLPYYGDFPLDSGAFTFMGGFDFKDNSQGVNFNEYAERYAAFINKNKIEKYFELDVDVCIGYDKVKELRRYLERATNRQPIPVWHSTRGKEDFIRCCDEYPYVALDGIVGGEWNAKAEKCIPWFIQQAHKRGAKIHGLGYTKLEKLKLYHFDSVDSTAWTAGNRFGYMYWFDGKTMQKTPVPAGNRINNARRAALNNYIEWIKFQKYADTHL